MDRGHRTRFPLAAHGRGPGAVPTFHRHAVLRSAVLVSVLASGCASPPDPVPVTDNPVLVMNPSTTPGVVGSYAIHPEAGHTISMTIADDAVWVVAQRIRPTGRHSLPRDIVSKINPDANLLTQLLFSTGWEGEIAVGEGAVWLASGYGDTRVLRIDASTGNVVATIRVEGSPLCLAVGEGAVWAFASHIESTGIRGNRVGWSIQRIDPNTNAIVNSLLLPEEEPWVGYGTKGFGFKSRPCNLVTGEGSIWVAHPRDGTVHRIDPHSNRIAATIASVDVADRRDFFWFHSVVSAGRAIWVVARERDRAREDGLGALTVWRIDPATNRVDGEPFRVRPGVVFAFDDDGLWIGDVTQGIVSRADPRTFAPIGSPINVGHPIQFLAAGRGMVWAVGRPADRDSARRITRLAPTGTHP